MTPMLEALGVKEVGDVIGASCHVKIFFVFSFLSFPFPFRLKNKKKMAATVLVSLCRKPLHVIRSSLLHSIEASKVPHKIRIILFRNGFEVLFFGLVFPQQERVLLVEQQCAVSLTKVWSRMRHMWY